MKKLSFIMLIAAACSFTACSDDDDKMNDPTFVTFNPTIKTIIDANCISCHNNPPINGAPMKLTTLDDVKEAVQSRNLVGRVEDGSMPPGNAPDLTAAQIQAIKDWRIGNFQD